MRIYLAARYSRFPEMQTYAKDIERMGHIVTSRWILGDHDIRAHGQSDADHYMPLWAQEDWYDLAQADLCISFTEPPGDIPGRGRGGRHVEFGIALMAGKPCIVVGYRENVFHWLPHVHFCHTWEECVDILVHKEATHFYPCTRSGCSHMGAHHTPRCEVCQCPEHLPWDPPPLPPDHTDEEQARRAKLRQGEKQ